MIYDLQKASIGKRLSAFLFDLIMFVTLAVGVAYIITNAVGYNEYSTRLEAKRTEYSEEYGVKLDITNEEFSKLTDSEKINYQKAQAAFGNDEEAQEIYYKMLDLLILILSLSPFISCLVLEFLIPLFLKNGQTLGKKIFGIGVMLSNGVRLNGVALFARAFLGKFAIETAIPMIAFVTTLFGTIGGIGALIILVIIATNLGLLLFTKQKTVIHDLVSYSVCVDLASQMIFENEAALEEYKNRKLLEQQNDSHDPYASK